MFRDRSKKKIQSVFDFRIDLLILFHPKFMIFMGYTKLSRQITKNIGYVLK
jgi:hypothetical protein